MRIALVLLPDWLTNTPSLAIAYLASHLIKDGHTVSRFEFNLNFSDEEHISALVDNEGIIKTILEEHLDLKERGLLEYVEYCVSSILEKKPDVVSFSVYKDNEILSIVVAKKIKEMNKKIKIIFGGPQTFYKHPGYFLNTGWVDYAVIGEGEEILPRLLRSLETSHNINLPGVVYLKNNKIVHGGEWVPKKNINEFNFPLFQKEDIDNSTPWIIPIITSRGCLGKCNFCTNRQLWKNFRQRTPENVLDEIKHQTKTLGITNFIFDDSALNLNMNFLKNFCELLIKEDIPIKWLGNVRSSRLMDCDMFNLMYKAGCRVLYFGAESGSNQILHEMDKQVTSELTEKNIRDAHRSNIWAALFFMAGYPNETPEDFVKTIKFIVRNSAYIDSFMFFSFKLKEEADISKKKNLRLVDEATVKRRLDAIAKIFEHKVEYCPNLLLEKDPISYKSLKSEYNSRIKINMSYYRKLLLNYKELL